MAERFRPLTESWSAQYELVHNAEVRTTIGEEAVMDEEMMMSLFEHFGRPLIGLIGGRHYQFKPTRSIPHGYVAVPEATHDDPDALLIQK